MRSQPNGQDSKENTNRPNQENQAEGEHQKDNQGVGEGREGVAHK